MYTGIFESPILLMMFVLLQYKERNRLLVQCDNQQSHICYLIYAVALVEK